MDNIHVYDTKNNTDITMLYKIYLLKYILSTGKKKLYGDCILDYTNFPIKKKDILIIKTKRLLRDLNKYYVPILIINNNKPEYDNYYIHIDE